MRLPDISSSYPKLRPPAPLAEDYVNNSWARINLCAT